MLMPDSTNSRFLKFLPQAWRPYWELARLDRPIGFWLLVLPCWQSSALAAFATGVPFNLKYAVLFLIGAVVMRGAGCTYNDLMDRDLDKKVARTRGRPLPSGRIQPIAAFLFLCAQLCVGALILFSLPLFAILLGLFSLLPILLYPFMKRLTSWPQFVLGLTFAYGALMGWATSVQNLTWAPFALYLSSIFWVIGYDTIYALQDKEDDAIAGIGSTALLFGEHVQKAIGFFYLLSILFVFFSVLLVGGNVWGFLGVLAFAVHLIGQIFYLPSHPSHHPRLCLDIFRSNRTAGFLLFLGFSLQFLVWS